MRANHTKPKQHTNQPDDPQIPQPDLRFVNRNNKPDTQKAPEPKQKHPQKRFTKGHSGLTTVSLSKPCENELSTTTFEQTWRPKRFACLHWHRCAEGTRTRGYNLCLSQRPLKSACPESLHGHSRYTIFTLSKNVVVVTVPGSPPVGGRRWWRTESFAGQWKTSIFFGRRPLPFGGSPLEAFSRTSGESNHHQQSVCVVKNNALPTEPRGHLGQWKTSILP